MTNKIKQLNLDENFNINSATEEIKKNGVVIINNFISNEDSNEIKKLLEGSQLRNSNKLLNIFFNYGKNKTLFYKNNI